MKKQERAGIYDQFRAACKFKRTTLTSVLKAINKSDGSVGAWKAGAFPRLDIVMDIAEYLDVSLDELCYGIGKAKSAMIDENQREWLGIVACIPSDKQDICKEFLKTHAVVPEKYDAIGEKIS